MLMLEHLLYELCGSPHCELMQLVVLIDVLKKKDLEVLEKFKPKRHGCFRVKSINVPSHTFH